MDNLNYGVIGNCCTAALISEKGSIEWLCFPNFDSSSIFAALLDREKGGTFGFEVSEDYHTIQSYVPHTNILSTTFVSEQDEFAVVDFMPCYELYDNKEYYRPAEVYRYIRWIKGRPRIKVNYHPAPDYARGKAFFNVTSRYIETYSSSTRVHSEAMRTALTEQYSAVADALGVLSEQLGRPGSPEPYKSGRVSALFAQLGTPPLECAVTLDDLGRTRAAVTLPRTRFNEKELAALAVEVGRICRRSLEPPQVLSCKGMTTLLFAEKPLLRAVFGTAGAAARGEISGDAVQQFCSAAAAQMILCDGMGTGRPAAVDGNLAAELTARLLKAGFTAELAARLVNVALALKSDEESGATLDLVSVDLYTGTARLFKAGAAPGFLVHGGKARAVGEASLPMGILGGVSGQSRVVHLAAGDYVVLVSDGLLVDGPGWVMQQLELSAAKAEQPDVLAKKLVEAARARAVQRGRPDDITAAVLRLENS